MSSHWPTLDDVRGFCNGACDRLGTPQPDQEDIRWDGLAYEARRLVENSWKGGTQPSPFKVMAAFSIAITNRAPMVDHISNAKERGLDEILSIRNGLRAVIAFEFSKSYLAKSKIGSAANLRKIDSPISVSRHFLKDFIHYLTAEPDFGMTSLVYESCVYFDNRDARNSDIIK